MIICWIIYVLNGAFYSEINMIFHFVWLKLMETPHDIQSNWKYVLSQAKRCFSPQHECLNCFLLQGPSSAEKMLLQFLTMGARLSSCSTRHKPTTSLHDDTRSIQQREREKRFILLLSLVCGDICADTVGSELENRRIAELCLIIGWAHLSFCLLW